MDAKHTPGPWIAQPDPNGSGDDYVIGIGASAPIDYVATCWKRDARLIAAAPDLLAVCQRIHDDLTLGSEYHEQLSAAIARATGEQP